MLITSKKTVWVLRLVYLHLEGEGEAAEGELHGVRETPTQTYHAGDREKGLQSNQGRKFKR
jgi:hypothetical protein